MCPSRPTDPIRDPELTRGEAEAFLCPPSPDFEADRKPGRDKLRAALQEDPPVRRYSVEEIEAAALKDGAIGAGIGAVLSHRGIDWSEDVENILKAVFEHLSLATAFDGATPTQRRYVDLTAVLEELKRLYVDAQVKADSQPNAGEQKRAEELRDAIEILRAAPTQSDSEQAKRDFEAYGEGSGAGLSPGSDEL